MIGWKRIVTTVGEKIGKEHLTYAQGASAELVAMATIMAADQYGLPVSTTHVLSSGIAGTMFANRSGLQMDTLRNLLLAWVATTLPVCVFLGTPESSPSPSTLLFADRSQEAKRDGERFPAWSRNLSIALRTISIVTFLIEASNAALSIMHSPGRGPTLADLKSFR